MKRAILYLDDSGTRYPDRKPPKDAQGHDFFALGGILINEEDKQGAEDQIDAFMQRWPEIGSNPLHSYEIRHCKNNFSWLGISPRKDRFYRDLQTMLTNLPVTGIACVIDRKGYNVRYEDKYKSQRWLLCKTAFCIVVERAMKAAHSHDDRKLRVYVERSSKQEEEALKTYYQQLKTEGAPFSSDTSGKYCPPARGEFAANLYEFATKTKKSRLMQIADLYLWPICQGGYDRNHRAYRALLDAGKIIDTQLPDGEKALLGVKYSCFDTTPKAE